MMELPELDETCTTCGGLGEIGGRKGPPVWESAVQCATCRGAKRVPTEAGKAILAFLAKHRR